MSFITDNLVEYVSSNSVLQHELENIISMTIALNDMKFPLMTCPVEYSING